MAALACGLWPVACGLWPLGAALATSRARTLKAIAAWSSTPDNATIKNIALGQLAFKCGEPAQEPVAVEAALNGHIVLAENVDLRVVTFGLAPGPHHRACLGHGLPLSGYPFSV